MNIDDEAKLFCPLACLRAKGESKFAVDNYGRDLDYSCERLRWGRWRTGRNPLASKSVLADCYARAALRLSTSPQTSRRSRPGPGGRRRPPVVPDRRADDDGWYPSYQGAVFYPRQYKNLSGPDAIHLFATQEDFPIEIGIDNYGGDTNQDYTAEIDQCAADSGTWLWWSYSSDVECPVSGATCQANVKAAPNGFGGASPLSMS